MQKIKTQVSPGFETRTLSADLNESSFVKRSKDFYEFIDTCQMASDRFGNSFTYTLINEYDYYVYNW